MHDICDKLGASVCTLLPLIHSVIGCDSTGSFAGTDKRPLRNFYTNQGKL